MCRELPFRYDLRENGRRGEGGEEEGKGEEVGKEGKEVVVNCNVSVAMVKS